MFRDVLEQRGDYRESAGAAALSNSLPINNTPQPPTDLRLSRSILQTERDLDEMSRAKNGKRYVEISVQEPLLVKSSPISSYTTFTIFVKVKKTFIYNLLLSFWSIYSK
jgi:hypothetical protein